MNIVDHLPVPWTVVRRHKSEGATYQVVRAANGLTVCELSSLDLRQQPVLLEVAIMISMLPLFLECFDETASAVQCRRVQDVPGAVKHLLALDELVQQTLGAWIDKRSLAGLPRADSKPRSTSG